MARLASETNNRKKFINILTLLKKLLTHNNHNNNNEFSKRAKLQKVRASQFKLMKAAFRSLGVSVNSASGPMIALTLMIRIKLKK